MLSQLFCKGNVVQWWRQDAIRMCALKVEENVNVIIIINRVLEYDEK